MNSEAGWSTWPAPAKLNLFLQIVGRRADGLHCLQTVFQLLDWGDTVHIRLNNDSQIRRSGGDTGHIPEEQDLLLRAACLLRATSPADHGADISVSKQIPVGGGFGGGSSNAATVLVALNRLWGLDLDKSDLAQLGSQLGADVPVFVLGQNAWAEGTGERLTPLDLPDSWFVLVDPGIHTSTLALFGTVELTRDAVPATMLDFISGEARGNVFEPVLRRLEPAVDSALKLMSKYGQACLTGTGSGCFLRFASRQAALDAQAGLAPRLASRVVAGARRSALIDALEAGPASAFSWIGKK